MNEIKENRIASAVSDAAFAIHAKLGPGLRESVNETFLAREVRRAGFQAVTQCPLPLRYEDTVFEEGSRADIVVNDLVIEEIKSVGKLAPVHGKQLLTYLKLTGHLSGLPVNFGEEHLKTESSAYRMDCLIEPFAWRSFATFA